MKLPHILLLIGVVLMAAAFVVPKVFGGRAALRGELEQELAASGDLHMATAHSHDDSPISAARAAEDSLQQRVDAALNRGQGTAMALKWLGIGTCIAGGLLLLLNNSRNEGK